MPVTWDEVARAAAGDVAWMFWSPEAALEHVAVDSDRFADVLHRRQSP